MGILEEAKWDLRKSYSEIIREAVTKYLEKNLSKDAQRKVKGLLKKAPEFSEKEEAK
jgi:Arc/MetJ-type ribon-helix-helix transcriptional regulator